MPDRTHLPRPTDSELAILRVLWERGPSTVREVQEALSASGYTTLARAYGRMITPREVAEAMRHTGAYTTVLKTLQIMTEKGLVVRDESERAHVYAAALSEQRTQRQLLGDLMDRAFGGSPAKLVMQALSGRKATPDDLNAIRELLDRLEGEEP